MGKFSMLQATMSTIARGFATRLMLNAAVEKRSKMQSMGSACDLFFEINKIVDVEENRSLFENDPKHERIR